MVVQLMNTVLILAWVAVVAACSSRSVIDFDAVSLLPVVNNTSCNSFYILDFPAEYMNAWPLPGTHITPRSKSGLDYHHEQGLHFGAGEAVNASRGLFKTHNPDHLYHMIMSRLRVHPHRTMSRSDACLLVIPLDLSINSFYHYKTGHYAYNLLTGCEHMAGAGEVLRKAVAEAPLLGHDMLFIGSSFSSLSKECISILHSCENCTRVNIEPNILKSDFHIVWTKRQGFNVTYRSFGVPYPSRLI
jgi:hypothetical protein